MVPNEPVPFSSETVEPFDCDPRFPAAAVLPVQGLWFIEWLQRRIQASSPARSIMYTGLINVCTQLCALTDTLKGHGISFPSGRIPFKLFLKLEGEICWSTGDWLDCPERHSYLRKEVIQPLLMAAAFENMRSNASHQCVFISTRHIAFIIYVDFLHFATAPGTQ